MPDNDLTLHAAPAETICGTLADLRDGRRTCVAVVEQCLARIDAWEHRVHAWVSVDRTGALNTARERDRELREGRPRGPLQGIPLGVKDIIDVAGWPTAAGSELLARGKPAAEDAPIVARLRNAGAIVLGKTVTTQFACFDPPVTRNPWNTAHTPGGSSSGSAAAVATGMCLGALGSQTGGSITRPASFCGVAGCKPTWGRVQCDGVYPLAPSMDHPGPIARTVRDLAVLLDVLCSPDAGQCSEAVHSPLKPPRIGRLFGMFDALASAAAKAAVDRALHALAAGGARVNRAELPDSFEPVTRQHRTVMAAEIAAWHGARFAEHPSDYLPSIRGIIEEGLTLPAAEYIRSRDHQIRLRRDMAELFAEADVLACPSTLDGAPLAATTGNPVFNAPWSYTGQPTITIPIGLNPDGLPLGLQLVGEFMGEPKLFQAAEWCERALYQ